MTTLAQQSSTLKIAGMVFGAPILLAFVIGASPVLIPVLLYRWLAQPSIRILPSQQARPRPTRPEQRVRADRRELAAA